LDDLVLNEAIYGSKQFNWTMPAYFIWGERDDLIPNSVGLTMMARNGVAMDHWYIVPKTGHVPCLEHPKGFAGVLRVVLAKP
jgi:pimeloyl-ACP methyl ester carboxylesterase